MRIALVGTGQMGTAVEETAIERGHEIVARYDVSSPLPETGGLEGTDVVVDFSLPGLAPGHIERFCRAQVPAVVGTTGWYDRLDEVERCVAELDGTVLYAANFSIGVALLVRSLRAIAPILDRLPEYDPYVHEIHHVKKVDSPSGTAHMLAGEMLEALHRKTHLETEAQHGRIDPHALHVTSTRAGEVFGVHTIGIDSPFDEIELTHRAKNRKGFAFGAVRAAEWIPGRKGLFTLDDVLADWLLE